VDAGGGAEVTGGVLAGVDDASGDGAVAPDDTDVAGGAAEVDGGVGAGSGRTGVGVTDGTREVATVAASRDR